MSTHKVDGRLLNPSIGCKRIALRTGGSGLGQARSRVRNANGDQETRKMEAPRIRIGNQTSCQVPSRVPYEFALRHGFDAFEWFSDRGRYGWCEADMDAV